MKKNFKLYVIAWAILLVVFNVISIVVPGWPTLEKCTPSFWIGYAFISAAMVGQLVCAWIAFKEDNIKKTFYNLSLFVASYAGLMATFAIGLICMILSPLPYWVGAVACPLVLAINCVAVLKAKIAVDLVTSVDGRVETATSFVYQMREESESLLARAAADEVKAICKRVRDAFKYSDPMSHAELAGLEGDIQESFALLKEAIAENKLGTAASECEELLALISERNNRCKNLK